MRAWYNESCYAVYTSHGIQTDSLPPETSAKHRVKEMTQQSTPADVDYFSLQEEITVVWQHVFRDAQAGIKEYHVAIGKHLKVY